MIANKEFNFKQNIGKCYKAICVEDKFQPELFFKIVEYNKEHKCYVVEGFVNSYEHNLPISSIFNSNIEKSLDFFKNMEEIEIKYFNEIKEKLLSVLN